MDIIWIFEIIGTIAFAVSGALTASEKEMDVFGVVILGTTTAIGGGIIRDLLLGVTPPAAFQDPVYAFLAIATSLVVFVPGVRALVRRFGQRPLLLMDAVGLAGFTVVGVFSATEFHNPFLSVFVGIMTGVGGGVLRDLFAGNRPYIFVRHFYACASLIGAAVTVLSAPLGKTVAMLLGAAVVVLLRLLAAKFRWSLPHARG